MESNSLNAVDPGPVHRAIVSQSMGERPLCCHSYWRVILVVAIMKVGTTDWLSDRRYPVPPVHQHPLQLHFGLGWPMSLTRKWQKLVDESEYSTHLNVTKPKKPDDEHWTQAARTKLASQPVSTSIESQKRSGLRVGLVWSKAKTYIVDDSNSYFEKQSQPKKTS